MPAKFTPNRKGLLEYERSDQLYPVLEAKAAPILERAQTLAAQHVESGRYLRSVHAERHRGPSRVAVRVVADDEKAELLEAQFHTLARAVVGR